jgi:3-dehydroquinate synthase/2-deoxy-scyllo-inosose synthase
MEQMDFVFHDRATIPGWLGVDCQGELLEHVRNMNADKILLVTEKNVDVLHGTYWDPMIASSDGPSVEKIVLPSGDEAKSWDHLGELVKWNFAVGATKKSVIVAFGGGALLNVAHLFASMMYRGMKLVSVPTTFLAMHDVVTSLKTSICFDGRKNNIGTFYAATKILIDVGFCRTLPSAELFSGLGELAKNACLFGAEHAEGFVKAFSGQDAQGGEFSLPLGSLLDLTRLGIKAKMDALATDAYEKNNGMLFEYGHTIGHAIEKAYGDGTIPHGLGVVYGMLSTSYACEKMGIMSAEDRAKHDEVCNLLISRWPLPAPLPSADRVYALAMRDSKRGITGEKRHEISDVMLTRIGEAIPSPTNNLHAFDSKLTQEWLATMFPTGAPLTSGFGGDAEPVLYLGKPWNLDPACIEEECKKC